MQQERRHCKFSQSIKDSSWVVSFSSSCLPPVYIEPGYCFTIITSFLCQCQSSNSKLLARRRLPKSMIRLIRNNDEDRDFHRTTDGALYKLGCVTSRQRTTRPYTDNNNYVQCGSIYGLNLARLQTHSDGKHPLLHSKTILSPKHFT